MKMCQRSHMTFLFVCLLPIISCTKTIDSTEQTISTLQSSDLTFPVTNEFASCKLRRAYYDIALPDGSWPWDTVAVYALFSYNTAGNPYSIVFRDASNGNQYFDAPTYNFIYDTRKRLKETNITYHEGREITGIHRYGYNNSDMIVTDSAISQGDEGVEYIEVSTFTYDNQQRIVKENIRNIFNAYGALRPDRNPTFTYDSRGNLAVAGWKSSSYDYKVSIFRSHPIFQFLHRNYSRNNAAPQPKYNSKGLPLSMNPANDGFFNAYLKSTGRPGISKAVYDCN